MATIADELNAISVEHGYTGAAPKTIAGAIDVLADTLAGTDVEGRRTIAGAVKALAPYVGGGGTTLGALQQPVIDTLSTPVVGEPLEQTTLKCTGLKIGSQAVLGFYESDGTQDCRVAAGVTYESMYQTAYSAEDEFHTYIATVDTSDWTYAAVEPADVVLSVVYDPDINMSRMSFVMPELDANCVLIIQRPTD